MFSAGEVVIYGTQGVCRVKEISVVKMGATKGEYYILNPVFDSKAVVYVPTAKPELVAKMRPVLSEAELRQFLDETDFSRLPWISHDGERKDFCDKVIKGGDRRELLRLMGMLYAHREELIDQKRHFHNVDAQYLKLAERIIFDELSFVLGLKSDEVPAFVRSVIE